MGIKKSFVWLLLVAVLGAVLGILIINSMNQYLDLEVVYIAKQEIEMDKTLSPDMFEKGKLPKKLLSGDAITDIQKIDGKYSRTRILKGQTLVERAISDANSIREVVQEIGLHYVGLTIPVDSTDFPIQSIKVGDIISVIGIFSKRTDEGQVIESQYISENVRVLDVIDDTKSGRPKLVVAIPRAEALRVARDIVAGKVRIILDPNAFSPVAAQEVPKAMETKVNAPSNQSSSQTSGQQEGDADGNN